MIPCNDDAFLFYAIKYYNNPSCVGMEEFKNDLKLFGYVKKSISRRVKNKSFNFNLTLNHIITLYNLFGVGATDLLFYKVKKEGWYVLKTYLLFLNFMPHSLKFDNKNKDILNGDNIHIDDEILQQLKRL